MKHGETAGAISCSAGTVSNDVVNKIVSISDGAGRFAMKLDYDGKCRIREAWVKGRQVLSAQGVYSGIRSADGTWHTSLNCALEPVVRVEGSVAEIRSICYGGDGIEVNEVWTFTAKQQTVLWDIRRNYRTGGILSDTCQPGWSFLNTDTWTGAVLDNGGVAWMKLLNAQGRTLGTHAGEVTFWDKESNSCLRMTSVTEEGIFTANRFTRQSDDTVIFCNETASVNMTAKYDLQNFRNAEDVWAPFPVSPGVVGIRYELSALDYDRAFDIGALTGLDGSAIREMGNTIARYGVIDNNHAGLNGWMTGYVCLHEPYLGKVAAAVGQPDYTKAVMDSFDFYRDHAVKANGRVLSRFQYMPGDEQKGTRTPLGFYEAQWGTLLDSQTGYVIVVSDLFHLSGALAWINSQKITCEKVLDYLLARCGDNGLVKMMNANTGEKRSSDWIDIVWAANENALVNAELFGALDLWAEIEDILKDGGKAAFYRSKAAALKAGFNQTVADGGFWDPENNQYVYWRDTDQTIHGTNFVIPVQFAAIGYGVCDDRNRIDAILSSLESEMVSEGLFSWPLCMTSFTAEETVTAFPGYENGDIFLSWNELGLRCYSKYDPAVAVRYVKNVINRYNSDGLAAQRYLRRDQTGTGEDILAGNYMTVAGLYSSIYGVRPLYDRLYLEPHITPDLNGTTLNYQLRGQLYIIRLLSSEKYQIAAGGFTFSHTKPFAVNLDRPDQISYFSGSRKSKTVTIARSDASSLEIDMADDSDVHIVWAERADACTTVTHTVSQRVPNRNYCVSVNGIFFRTLTADGFGNLTFAFALNARTEYNFEVTVAESNETMSAAGTFS